MGRSKASLKLDNPTVIEQNIRLQVPGVPNVSVYPDDKIPGGFYSLSDSPRLALDEQQRPQMKLILYGKQERLRFQIAGGFVAITTSLGIHDHERTLLTAALQTRLRRENPGSFLRWLQIIWMNGRCDLWLTKDIQLTAEPSLYGDNFCVFQASCNQAVAHNLEEAWRDNHADIYVRYKITPQASHSDFLCEGKLNTASYEIPPLITRVNLT